MQQSRLLDSNYVQVLREYFLIAQLKSILSNCFKNGVIKLPIWPKTLSVALWSEGTLSECCYISLITEPFSHTYIYFKLCCVCL